MCPFMYCPGMVGGSWDTLTGECSVLLPIHVLSRDGQSILGYSDRGGAGGSAGGSAHPCAILGRSEYFGSYGQVWYNPCSILRISMPFNGVTGHPSIVNNTCIIYHLSSTVYLMCDLVLCLFFVCLFVCLLYHKKKDSTSYLSYCVA